MSYRKITVDNKQHEYVTGKTHTRIKGFGVYLNAEIGETFERPKELGGGKRTFITPGMISDIIRGVKPRPLCKTQTSIHKCKHGVETPLTTPDPLSSVVYQEYRPMIACPQCELEASWEI